MEAMVMDLARGCLLTVVKVCGPVIGAITVVGLVVGVLQAATQVQEVTIPTVAKIVVCALVLLFGGPWLLRVAVEAVGRVLLYLPNFAG
ncbi:MAG TPA: EscS/YscS/HrcS family type III secretion system export apparatus protein [Armatimonadetes bacterium]|nr:EscS/YscS/HrcS family type III secretion system export apparatus protein [Armatimonadota bacterium]